MRLQMTVKPPKRKRSRINDAHGLFMGHRTKGKPTSTHTQMEIRQMLTTHIIYTFIHDISVLVKMHHL